MSSTNIDSFPNISGGIPTSSDFAPSIVFILLFAPLCALTLYRCFQYRTPILFFLDALRLNVFANIRVVTYIIRAIEANQAKNGQVSPQLSLFIAEQVLLGIGYIVLILELVTLLRAHIKRTDLTPPPAVDDSFELGKWRLSFMTLQMLAGLFVALALGIVAGVNYGSSITNPSVASSTKTERIISGAISLGVTAWCILLSLYVMASSPRHPKNASIYLLVTSCFLIIVPAYRISSLENSTSSVADLTSTTTKAEFWILQATMEWIVLLLLTVVDVRTWFGAGGEKARQAMMARGSSTALELGMTVLKSKSDDVSVGQSY